MTNVAAYYRAVLITAVKSFIVQAPGVKVTKCLDRNLHKNGGNLKYFDLFNAKIVINYEEHNL